MKNVKSKLFILLLIYATQIMFFCVEKVRTGKVNWDYNKGGEDWPETCKRGDQAPLDISQPFKFKKSEISFHYSNMMTEYSFYNDGNNLVMEGDYGYMTYNGVNFFSSAIYFYSPSMHSFSNKKLPFEMQIVHQDDQGNILTVSILYRYSKQDYSLFLGKLGFDDVLLKEQKAFKPKIIKEEINMSKYVNDGKDFFIYDSLENAPPCEKKATYLILTDVLKISKKQLDNFPLMVKNKARNIQKRGNRVIYTTFKMEDVEKKVKENRDKVEALKKQKEEAQKLDAAADKKEGNALNAGDEKKSDLEKKYKKDDIEKVKKELDDIKKKQMEKNQTQGCEDSKVIPFEQVKETAKAYDDYTKTNDPKFLSNMPEKNDTLIIDRDIPLTDSEVRRNLLMDKYKLWKDLLEEQTHLEKQGKTSETHVLIQMKLLENELKKNNFEPYMNEKVQKEDDMFLSFIQLSEQVSSEVNKPVNSYDDIMKDLDKIEEKVGIKEDHRTVEPEHPLIRQMEKVHDNIDDIINHFKHAAEKNNEKITEAELKIEHKLPTETENKPDIKITAPLEKIFDLNKHLDDVVNSQLNHMKKKYNVEKNPEEEVHEAVKETHEDKPDVKMTVAIPSNNIGSHIDNALKKKVEDLKQRMESQQKYFDKLNELPEENLSHNQKGFKMLIRQKIVDMKKMIRDIENKYQYETNKMNVELTVPVSKGVEIIHSEHHDEDDDHHLTKIIISHKPEEEHTESSDNHKVDLKVTMSIPPKEKPDINLEEQIKNKNQEDELKSYQELKDSFEKIGNNVEILTAKKKAEHEDHQDIIKQTDAKSDHLQNQNEKFSDVVAEVKSVVDLEPSINKNVKELNKMKSVVDVLSKSLEEKEKTLNINSDEAKEGGEETKNPVESNAGLLTDVKSKTVLKKQGLDEELPHINLDSYDTNLDYDKKIYNVLKSSLYDIVSNFKSLDSINSKSEAQRNSLLNDQGYINVSNKNFAALIRAAYSADAQDHLSLDEKIAKINKSVTQLLLNQNILSQGNVIKENSAISMDDINNILEEVMLKNELNQYVIPNMDKLQTRNLIVRALQKLPIALLKGKVESYEPTEASLQTEPNYFKEVKTVKSDDHANADEVKVVVNDDDLFITTKNANRLRGSQEKIFGPKVEEKINQISPKPGQGRKSVSREGTVDTTDIFETTTWPSKCKDGQFQSPININKPYVPEEIDFKLQFKQPTGNLSITNDGFKLIFRADDFGIITHGVHDYKAKQIEIHHPSEHTFGDDEIRSPLEFQIICQDMFGNTAAVSVLFKLDEKDNPLLSALGFGVDNPLFALKLRNNEEMQLKEEKVGKDLDLGPLLNHFNHYVTYVGSLTSPPCTQGVRWFVLLQKLNVSQNQLEYFPVLFGRDSNVRGLQNLNERPLKII
jgi:carbonic anhydrase